MVIYQQYQQETTVKCTWRVIWLSVPTSSSERQHSYSQVHSQSRRQERQRVWNLPSFAHGHILQVSCCPSSCAEAPQEPVHIHFQQIFLLHETGNWTWLIAFNWNSWCWKMFYVCPLIQCVRGATCHEILTSSFSLCTFSQASLDYPLLLEWIGLCEGTSREPVSESSINSKSPILTTLMVLFGCEHTPLEPLVTSGNLHILPHRYASALPQHNVASSEIIHLLW